MESWDGIEEVAHSLDRSSQHEHVFWDEPSHLFHKTQPLDGTESKRRAIRFETELGYELQELIAQGGQGEVWVAEQLDLQRHVAVKIVKPESEVYFRQEAIISASLDHPNIIPAHQLFHIDHEGQRRPALAMRFIEGVSWMRLIRKEHPGGNPGHLYLNRHLRIFLTVCNAVAYAHSKQIIHRDLKPHQVVVGNFGEIYLTDWGMAVSLVTDPKTPTARRNRIPIPTILSDTAILGTPLYMAPEQAAGDNSKLGLHTDIYLLGATLFEIVTGQPPRSFQNFRGLRSVTRDIVRNELRPIPDWVPDDLRTLILQCLATNPAERPTTVVEVHDRVQEHLDGSRRRREADELLQEMREELDRNAELKSYDDLEPLLAKVRLLEASPAPNQSKDEIRREIVTRQVELALTKGDLGFARGACAGLQGKDDRIQSLLDRIESAEQEEARQRAQRRVAIRLVAALLLVLLIGAGWAALTQAEAAAELRKANTTAEVQRSLAVFGKKSAEESLALANVRSGQMEEVVQAFINDLTIQFRAIDNVESLKGFAKPLLDYYQGQPQDQLSIHDKRQLGKVLSQLAAIFISVGDLDRGLEGCKLAFPLLKESYEADQRGEDVMILAHVTDTQAFIGESRGHYLDAIKNSEIAFRYRQAAMDQDGDAFDVDHLAWHCVKLAYLHALVGDREKTQEWMDRCIEYLSAISSDVQQLDRRQNFANTVSWLQLLSKLHGFALPELPSYLPALSFFEERLDLGTPDSYFMKDFLRYRSHLIQIALVSENPSSAEALLTNALSVVQRMQGHYPKSIWYPTMELDLEYQSMTMRLAAKNLQQASIHAQRVEELAEAMKSRAPLNRGTMVTLAICQLIEAEAARSRQEESVAAAFAQQAEVIIAGWPTPTQGIHEWEAIILLDLFQGKPPNSTVIGQLRFSGYRSLLPQVREWTEAP